MVIIRLLKFISQNIITCKYESLEFIYIYILFRNHELDFFTFYILKIIYFQITKINI